MDTTVVLLVVASRFMVPLAIPKFPLPAIVVALVIDAADQTIFQAFDAVPDNYQVYDKALDVFYLAIAYLSTIRNWTDEAAFRTAQFLWYYRLLGVVAFELSGARALLLIFPNTFEYFFIAYEVVRLRWEPSRLSTRAVIGTALAIWVFVKLPQEWWIHIARLDVTDLLSDHPWLWPALAVLAAAVGAVAFSQRRRIPAPDWPLSVHVDAHPTTVLGERAAPPAGAWALINHALVEKTLLVGLVTVIFVQLLPEYDTGPLQTVLGVGFVIVVNSVIGSWLLRQGTTWTSTVTQFSGMAAVNVGIVLAVQLLLGDTGDRDTGNTLFLLMLLTLIVTLYDRYRALRLLSLHKRWVPTAGPVEATA